MSQSALIKINFSQCLPCVTGGIGHLAKPLLFLFVWAAPRSEIPDDLIPRRPFRTVARALTGALSVMPATAPLNIHPTNPRPTIPP